jgi:hypothetical protein
MLTAEEHIQYFTTYALTLIEGFATYVTETERNQGSIDMLADRVGYREVAFYASPQELDVAFAAVNQAIIPLIQQEAGNGRRQYKFATIVHPQKI